VEPTLQKMMKKKLKRMEKREMWWIVVAKTRKLPSVSIMLLWVSLYRP